MFTYVGVCFVFVQGCDSSGILETWAECVTVYTAGADGMVCKIDVSDGSVAGKFKSSSKAISALAVSSGISS